MNINSDLQITSSEKAIIIIAALIVIFLILIILYRLDNTPNEEKPKKNKRKEEEDFEDLSEQDEMAEEKIGELFNSEPPKITPNENIGDIDFGNMGTAAAAPIAEALDDEETSEDEAEMPEEELDENDPFNDDNLEEPEAIEESEDFGKM